jgi:hypothetical protein
VTVLALAFVLAGTAAGALAAQSAPARSAASPKFDHCLLGKWVLRASNAASFQPSLIGLTLDVALKKGMKEAATFTYNFNGAAGIPAGTLRGTESMIVTSGIIGYMGVDTVTSHIIVISYGKKVPLPDALPLGSNTTYKCNASAFRVTWTDGGMFTKGTFRRP